MHRWSKAVFVVSACLVSGAASAQTSGRFSFQPVEGGAMRLDTETGHVSLCIGAGAQLVCRSVADDRAALDEEINRLKRENDSLRQAVAKGSASPRLSLPSDADIDKAMGLFEKMMRRMMRTFKEEAPDKI
jgi:hypothetical protein